MIYQKGEKIEKIKHLYIHIPFCKKKCFYCDFYSESVATKFYKLYTDKLIEELKIYEPFLNQKLQSVYFGGGTPYLLNISNLKKIIFFLRNYLDFNKTEISIELNPYNFLKEKSVVYKLSDIGFNRFSIGVQTFNQDIAKSINRLVPVDFHKTLIKLNNFNLNLDFMFGIGKQTLKSLDYDIKLSKEIQAKHLSYYLFTVPKTIKTPSNSTQEKMYQLIINSLKNDYIHYEVSNFSLNKNYYSKHNLAYWTRKHYLGIGAAAHSFVKYKNSELRYANIASYKIYLNAYDKINMLEHISKNQILTEKIFLGLRLLKKGLNIKLVKDKLKPLKNFLYLKNNKVFIKENKIFLIDEISKFLISD